MSDYVSAMNDHQARQDAALRSPDDAVDSRFAIGIAILRDAGYTTYEVRPTGGGIDCLVLTLTDIGNLRREVFIGPDKDGHDAFSIDLSAANPTFWLGGWNVERTGDDTIEPYGRWLVRTIGIVQTLHLSIRVATGGDFEATRY